jgi:DNA-binding MarR family transcriptional regulator
MNDWSVRLGRRAAVDGPVPSTDQRIFVIDESLGYLVNRAARLMAGELAERIRPAGVAIGQWAVLLVLWARDGQTQSELARTVAIEPPTIVRTIDRMERDGLVVRRADPRDARLTRIHLTDRGQDLRDRLIPEAVAVNEAVGSRLTPAEARTLRRLLAKVVTAPPGPPS